MRIAELSESSNLRTQNALPGYPWEHVSSSFGYYLRSTFLISTLGVASVPTRRPVDNGPLAGPVPA